MQAEVFDADSGGHRGHRPGRDQPQPLLERPDHERRRRTSRTRGVRVTELNSTGNALGQSASQAGAYDSVGGTLLPATVQSAAPVTSLGYFAVGRVAGTPTFPGGTYTVGATGQLHDSDRRDGGPDRQDHHRADHVQPAVRPTARRARRSRSSSRRTAARTRRTRSRSSPTTESRRASPARRRRASSS